MTEGSGLAEKQGIVLSGMRPTGILHLGNYMGALENWVRLQDQYRCYFMVADWHALTTDYLDPSRIRQNTHEMVLDWLAAGLDPERAVIFRQSQVKQHAELHLLLSMLVPLGWLERVPTYKEQLRQLEERQIANYGFFGYPVLQTADIIMYKATAVPVGEDQASHIELAREIVRRFNHLYGPVFPEPQTLLTEAKVLPGIDARKMSKSYNNYIPLTASPQEVREKVRVMVTDPARVRRTDPGNPEICTVYAFHKLFTPGEEVQEIAAACRTAGIGCVECKQRMAGHLIRHLEPIYERKLRLEKTPGIVAEVLAEGEKRARVVAEETMVQVRAAMGLEGS